jgi:hypothetical protein
MNWLKRKADINLDFDALVSTAFNAVKRNMKSPDSTVFEKDVDDVVRAYLSYIGIELNKAIIEKIKQAKMDYQPGGWK